MKYYLSNPLANNGIGLEAPSSDVMAPTGKAEPFPRQREAVSARSRRMLPLRADAGIEIR